MKRKEANKQGRKDGGKERKDREVVDRRKESPLSSSSSIESTQVYEIDQSFNHKQHTRGSDLRETQTYETMKHKN